MGRAPARSARRTSRDRAQIALASCLVQPFADVVVSGATTMEQMLSNLESCRLNLGEETITRLSVLSEPTEQYWAKRAKLPWN